MLDTSTMEIGALGFEVMFGSLTITGSLMAFGKLQGLLPSAPITYRFQNAIEHRPVRRGRLPVLVSGRHPLDGRFARPVFYLMVVVGLVVGVLIVMPIGGADMPVVISLLNSYAGLASSATGIALGNNVLIIAGALDGASGFLLSILMSKAMNRSFANVLFGAFGGSAAASAASTRAGRPNGQERFGRGRRRATGLRPARDRHPRLRHGGGPGPASGSRAGRADRKARRRSEVRHPSGRRPHAGPHERAVGRGQHRLRQAVATWTRSTANFRGPTWRW